MSEQRKAQSSKRSAASSTRSRDLSVSFKPSFQQGFQQGFRDHFPVRLHMTVLLSGVLTSGLFFSKLLFEFGMDSMWARYLIAVSASYAVFFLLIKVWLWCVFPSPTRRHSSSDVDILDPADLGRLSGDLIEGGTSVPVHSAVSGHGGDFGGGGASDVWGYQPLSSSATQSTAAAGVSHHANSGGGSGGGGFDLGDEAVVLIALAILVLVIFGAGAYLVYAAPEILSEAAFQALLAAGLIKASQKMTRQGWMGSVLRATCVPFLIVLLMTGIFGWVAHIHYPHATRLADIFKAPPIEKR